MRSPLIYAAMQMFLNGANDVTMDRSVPWFVTDEMLKLTGEDYWAERDSNEKRWQRFCRQHNIRARSEMPISNTVVFTRG